MISRPRTSQIFEQLCKRSVRAAADIGFGKKTRLPEIGIVGLQCLDRLWLDEMLADEEMIGVAPGAREFQAIDVDACKFLGHEHLPLPTIPFSKLNSRGRRTRHKGRRSGNSGTRRQHRFYQPEKRPNDGMRGKMRVPTFHEISRNRSTHEHS